MKATACAHANIALIKYWGKREGNKNLPAVGSISITLREMTTVSTVSFRDELDTDVLILNNKEGDEGEQQRVSQFLDLIRKRADISLKAIVESRNNFPTGAGLASSASAFASLALAASTASGLSPDSSTLSEIARYGSGSAARSIFGGFVEMKKGGKADGSDSIALQLANENYWDIHVLIAITSEKKKEISSTYGMKLTADTSPFYPAWVESSQQDLDEMKKAIACKDFSKLGDLSEFSCLKMHATALSAYPGLLYWNSTTIECIHAIRQMRKEGIPVYFTIDAGPQVKAICLPENIEHISSVLQAITGVKRIISTPLGPSVTLLEKE
ncbi:MAG: diphosphomevalonate decarboxylase [Calditrichaeota bacterium]|nr:diphosphomevalonate decarboxylase [Calditrichota bacterium]RQV93018.1 MAG: diphosphomevalonate decarboxylase [bacterium]RQW08227.1 MAG: diphosphomevalonate decarboxylase [Calditrichota bacterium]